MKKHGKLFVAICLTIGLLSSGCFYSCDSNPEVDNDSNNTEQNQTDKGNDQTTSGNSSSNTDDKTSGESQKPATSGDNSSNNTSSTEQTPSGENKNPSTSGDNSSTVNEETSNTDQNSSETNQNTTEDNTQNNTNNNSGSLPESQDSQYSQDSQTGNNSENQSGNQNSNQNESQNQNGNQNENQSQTLVAKNVDCQITETDLGGWADHVLITASKFSEMVSGDYITITTIASPTNSDAAQLGLCDGAWTNIGSDGTCSNVSSYSSEYTCYTLDAAAQNTVFTPSDDVIATLKSKGMIIKGQGVKVTSVVIRVNANLDVNEDPVVTPITSDLCDASATENAKHLFKYIKAMYGSKVITGQMENAWNNDCNMLQRVYDDTGKYPALMGFDFMDYTGIDWDASSFNKQTERAINFWNGKDWNGNKISDNQGIVAFCWHWFDPLHQDYSYKPGDGTNGTTSFRIPYNTETNSWKTNSDEYNAILADMDVIATELLKLQTAGVPVLWRPLHEGAGNLGGGWDGAAAWFWWGAGNDNETAASTDVDNCAECYIALWKLMYNYFTKTKGIHNLIWVWNGQNAKFYPGADYVDIIGDDIYESFSEDAASSQVHNSNKAAFQKFQAWDSTKLTTLSECGNLPDITSDGALWSYFMIWNDGEYDNTNNCVTKNTHNNNFWSGEFFNSATKKTEIYTSATAITLDELPDLTTY